MGRPLRAALLALAGCGAAGLAAAAAARPAPPFCTAIAQAVDAAAPGGGPVFVASYRPDPAGADLPEALKTSAFSYDNALAAIALVACGDTARAVRIGDAFVAAAARDRTFRDGRIRNAYRAGAVEPGPAKLPGWWDAAAKQWDEDAYQDGTSTGNVAWVALALLHLHAATDRPAYLSTATTLLAWIGAHADAGPGPAGFSGGVTGFDPAQTAEPWKSTEHNIDVAAASAWAARLTSDAKLTAMASKGRQFVEGRFQPGTGSFLMGTTPNGQEADPGKLALDVQLWPILGIADAPPAWRRALGFADAHLRRGDGMTFAGIGTNRWTEGTAQAAVAFRAVEADALADTFLGGLAAHASPSGLLYATSAGEVPTGLAVEAENGGAFTYFHYPHLGATAWAALAATRWNPFTGKKVG